MPTDQQLALRSRAGDNEAFEQLAVRYDDMVGAKAAAYSGRGESPEDFRQAALLGLFKAACSYRPDRGTAFGTWASIVINAALVDFLAKACRLKYRALDESLRFEQHVPGAHDEPIEFGAVIPGPASTDPCAVAIAREDFARHLRVLTSDCSTVERTVVARRLSGLKLAEVNRSAKGGLQPQPRQQTTHSAACAGSSRPRPRRQR